MIIVLQIAGAASFPLPLKAELHSNISSEDLSWLNNLYVYAHKHMGDCDFALELLDDVTKVSSRQLRRRMEKLTGLKPNEFLKEIRLQKAMQMLNQSEDIKVRDVASAVGFRDVKYFTKMFKKRFNSLPSSYRDT